MSEIKDFKFDIFISYSHEDNIPFVGTKAGWVTQFHEALENWLKHRRGLKKLTIWRDKELQGNTRFDDSIENAISSSALFFVLHSINYSNSEYCKKELDWFVQHHSSSLIIGEQSRIFHILLNNFPFDQWPKQLAGTSGFAMHNAETAESLGDFTPPIKDAFIEQLGKIVVAVQTTLEAMVTNTAAVQKQQQPNQNNTQIFIADTADSQAKFRKRLVAELKEQSNQIVANIPPPYDLQNHRQRVSEVLQQTQLAVHLLDQYPGREIDAQINRHYPYEQVNIGFEAACKQIIWVPPELNSTNIEEDYYRDWLIQLENGERQQHNYQFVRSSQSALLDLLQQEIDKLQHRQKPSAVESSFLIDTHQKDQQYAYQLAGIMAGAGINVEFNKESNNPVESLSLFEQGIQQIPNLIIVFGRVAPGWLAGRIKQALKIIARQLDSDNSLLLENIWVFLTPDNPGPETLPTLPRLIPVTLLDNSDSTAIDSKIIELLLHGTNA